MWIQFSKQIVNMNQVVKITFSGDESNPLSVAFLDTTNASKSPDPNENLSTIVLMSADDINLLISYVRDNLYERAS